MNWTDLSPRRKEHSRLGRRTESVTEVTHLKTISRQAECSTETILRTLVFSGPAESTAWGIWKDRTFACWPGRFGHHSMHTNLGRLSWDDWLLSSNTESVFELSWGQIHQIWENTSPSLSCRGSSAVFGEESKEMAVKLGTIKTALCYTDFPEN